MPAKPVLGRCLLKLFSDDVSLLKALETHFLSFATQKGWAIMEISVKINGKILLKSDSLHFQSLWFGNKAYSTTTTPQYFYQTGFCFWLLYVRFIPSNSSHNNKIFPNKRFSIRKCYADKTSLYNIMFIGDIPCVYKLCTVINKV